MAAEDGTSSIGLKIMVTCTCVVPFIAYFGYLIMRSINSSRCSKVSSQRSASVGSAFHSELQGQGGAQADDERECAMRAALLCANVYTDFHGDVEEDCKTSGVHFKFIHVPYNNKEDGRHKIIVAMDQCDGKSTLYVCFKGTAHIRDFFTDVRCNMKELRNKEWGTLDGAMVGSFHHGILERVQREVPSMMIFHHLLTSDSIYEADRIIFCGHSLGGAVAQMTHIIYSFGGEKWVNNCRPSQVITFGTPHICNKNARDCLKRYAESIINYVTDKDPIPRLLNGIPESWRNLYPYIKVVERFFRLTNCIRLTFGALLSLRDSYMAWDMRLRSANLENLDSRSGTGRAGNKFSKLGENLGRIFTVLRKLCESGNQGETTLYVPIGKYRSPAHEEISLDQIGSERLKTLTDEDTQFHRMAHYLFKMKQSSKSSRSHPPTSSVESRVKHLAPSVKEAVLELSAKSEQDVVATIKVTGKDLVFPLLAQLYLKLKGPGQPKEMGSINNQLVPINWSIIPDSSSTLRFRADVLVAKAHRYLNSESHFTVEVVTSFGSVKKDICKISGLQLGRISWNSPIAHVYSRSLRKIALVFAACSELRSQGKIFDAWLLLGSTKLHLQRLENVLETSSFLSMFHYLEDATHYLENIMKEQISIRRRISVWRISTFLLNRGLVEEKVGENELLLHVAKLLKIPADDRSDREELGKVLHQYIQEHPTWEDITRDKGYSKSSNGVYLYSQDNREKLIRRMSLINTIQSASEKLKSFKVVAVVGGENAGKSTLIDSILQKENLKGLASDDSLGLKFHTTQVKGYKLREDVLIVDTPGTGAPQERTVKGEGDGEVFRRLQEIPDLCVVVSRFSGDVGNEEERLSTLARQNLCKKVILVVNHMDSVLKGPLSHGEDCVWRQLDRDGVANLRKKYADVTGVGQNHVFMTVLGEVRGEEKPLLEERGVLLRDEAVEKLLSVIRE